VRHALPPEGGHHAGRFRQDLYYRLNGLTLTLPPLRERGDLPHLVAQMLEQALPGRGWRWPPNWRRPLPAYRWPGNLRQLPTHCAPPCALLGDGEAQIGWQHLPDDLAADLRAAPPPRSTPEATGR
jgi:transcriptional regulator of acetoin/glycerol metabolism